MSYWLCLNEGFRCNCIKINKYYNFCVVCKWSKCVTITIFGDLFNVTSIKSLNQHLGKNLHWSIVISKKKNLFIISSSVISAIHFGISLFHVIFVLNEKGEIILLLTMYWICTVSTWSLLNQWYSYKFVRSKIFNLIVIVSILIVDLLLKLF